MKKLLLSMAMLALCLASCKKETKVETEKTTTTTENDSVGTKEETPEAPMDTVAMMEAWKKYATPGDAHKMMADETGTWTNEMTMWQSPDAPPEKATATSDSKMIMGGRYQEMNYKGTMMKMPFEGRSTLAYDNATKEYISTWIDNMGTGMMVMKGTMADGAKSMEMKGDMVDPATGKMINCREVYTIVDRDTRKMEMYCNSNGKEHKNMEIIMKRKK